jgi:hypothetical protein
LEYYECDYERLPKHFANILRKVVLNYVEILETIIKQIRDDYPDIASYIYEMSRKLHFHAELLAIYAE